MSLTFLLPPSLGRARADARAELLMQTLSTEIGRPVTVVVPESYDDLSELATSRNAQFGWCPAAVCARIEPTARCILKNVRQGQASYRSVIVSRRGEVHSLSELRGLRAAWVDRLSMGGYLLARDYLSKHGVKVDETFESQTFLGSHPGAVNAVLHGTADVTAVTTPAGDEASVQRALELYVGPAARKLSVVAVTDASPNDGIALFSSLSAADEERILPGAPCARPPRGDPPAASYFEGACCSSEFAAAEILPPWFDFALGHGK